MEELNGLIELNKQKLSDLRASGNEHDLLCADELQKRYRAKLSALKEINYMLKTASEFEAPKDL